MEKEISIVEMENCEGKKYKVTKRVPELSVSETKFFRTKSLAQKQLNEWLE